MSIFNTDGMYVQWIEGQKICYNLRGVHAFLSKAHSKSKDKDQRLRLDHALHSVKMATDTYEHHWGNSINLEAKLLKTEIERDSAQYKIFLLDRDLKKRDDKIKQLEKQVKELLK